MLNKPRNQNSNHQQLWLRCQHVNMDRSVVSWAILNIQHSSHIHVAMVLIAEGILFYHGSLDYCGI